MSGDWMTEANVASAHALWLEGLSAKQIAVTMGHGCTKNSIIGIARRRGWPARPSPIIRTSAPKRVPAAKKATLVFPAHTRSLQYDHAQIALLRAQWGKHLDPREICQDFNASGPAKLTLEQLTSLARRLNLSRPLSWKKAMAREYARSRKTFPHKAVVRGVGAPIIIPLREVYQRTAQLGLPLNKRGDIDALNRAMKREQPSHPGFAVNSHQQPSRLAWR